MAEPRRRFELVSRELLAARLREEVSRATRHRLPLALLVFDLGTPGEGGESLEQLTRAAALLTRGVVRRDDVVGLLSPGAFAVVANTTPEGAGTLAEQVIRCIEAFDFAGKNAPAQLELRCRRSCLTQNRSADDLLREACAGLAARGADLMLGGRM